MNAPARNTYSTYSEIKIELDKRRKDKELEARVREFLGSDFPDFLVDSKEPYAFVSRAIFSPTMEMRFMMDMAESYKLKPMLLEYPGKFVSVNPEKLHLAKLRFFERTNREKMKYRVLNTIDFQMGR